MDINKALKTIDSLDGCIAKKNDEIKELKDKKSSLEAKTLTAVLSENDLKLKDVVDFIRDIGGSTDKNKTAKNADYTEQQKNLGDD